MELNFPIVLTQKKSIFTAQLRTVHTYVRMCGSIAIVSFHHTLRIKYLFIYLSDTIIMYVHTWMMSLHPLVNYQTEQAQKDLRVCV
jgi:hypothetical protein